MIIGKGKGYIPKGYPHVQRAWKKSTPLTVLGYTAGFLDGEGSIFAGESGEERYVRVYLTNTKRECLDFIARWFPHRVEPRSGQAFQTRLQSRQNIIAFLTPLVPYLVIKKPQALLAIRICKQFNTEDWLTLRHSNGRASAAYREVI